MQAFCKTAGCCIIGAARAIRRSDRSENAGVTAALCILALLAAATLSFSQYPYEDGPGLHVPAKRFMARSGLPNTAAKLRNGDSVTLAFLGGSTTADASRYAWAQRVPWWLGRQFPQAVVVRINAGLDGNRSYQGAARIQTDVLVHAPDLIFIEYAVNDFNMIQNWVNMESMVRQTWAKYPETEMVFLYAAVVNDLEEFAGGVFPRDMSEHEIAAEYYGVPSICMGLEICNRVNNGQNVWSDFFYDPCHYIEAGGLIYAEEIANALSVLFNVGVPGPHVLPDTLLDPVDPYQIDFPPLSNPCLTYLKVSPIHFAAVTDADWYQFHAVGIDQYGFVLANQPQITWAASCDLGTINSRGIFTAGAGRYGTCEIRATATAGAGVVSVGSNITVAPIAKVTGTVFGTGTPLAFKLGFEAALDGYFDTYPDCEGPADLYVGYEFERERTITSVKYWPRDGWPERMNGNTFEVSDDGAVWTIIHIITETPQEGTFTTAIIDNPRPASMIRYHDNCIGYLNVIEMEFYVGNPAVNSIVPKIVPRTISTAKPMQIINASRTILSAVTGSEDFVFDIFTLGGRRILRFQGSGPGNTALPGILPAAGTYVVQLSREDRIYPALITISK